MFEIYEVGGAVRDSLMGVSNKDFDYSVVIPSMIGQPIEIGFATMREFLINNGYEIFQENPSCLTIRCKFPKHSANRGITADFVLARKETYNQYSRIPTVTVGSLYDDAVRRDFSVNALFRKDDGTIIDFFNGVNDIRNKVLNTPIDPWETFTDDPLRALRAVRFSITKGFWIADRVMTAMSSVDLTVMTKQKVSAERIREELQKCFKFSTFNTMKLLMDIHSINGSLVEYWISAGGMWLKPTFEKKG